MAIAYRAAGATTAGTTSVILPQPTGTSTGDVLVAFVLDHATTGTTTPPTGWTRRDGIAGTTGRFQVFTAVVGSGGLTGTSWTWSSLTTHAVGVIMGFTGVDNTNPYDTSASKANASGTVSGFSIVPNNSGGVVIAGLGSLANGSTWSAETFGGGSVANITERTDAANSTFCSIATVTADFTGVGGTDATGGPGATMATAGANAVITFVLKVASVGGTPTNLFFPFLM